jgi:hypothetical protein
MLNKEPRTNERGCPQAWGLGLVLTTLHHKKINLLRKSLKSLRPEWIYICTQLYIYIYKYVCVCLYVYVTGWQILTLFS